MEKLKTNDHLLKNAVSDSTPYLVRGFIDNHPIYNKGNWNTKVNIGDILVCSFTGFGSEVLNYGERYLVVKNENKVELKSEKGEIINEWHTKNTMPFFTKLR
jgi:hypothetical protein